MLLEGMSSQELHRAMAEPRELQRLIGMALEALAFASETDKKSPLLPRHVEEVLMKNAER
jgi:hypothetical protein